MGFGIWAGWLYYMGLMHGVQKVYGYGVRLCLDV